MKGETKAWLQFSEENLQSALVLLQSGLFNPCLQNVQQCVEKALKAILIENSSTLRKTHDVFELKVALAELGAEIDLTDDECDFLNSIYLPSKYPIGSALPDFEPGMAICKEAVGIAEKVTACVKKYLHSH